MKQAKRRKGRSARLIILKMDDGPVAERIDPVLSMRYNKLHIDPSSTPSGRLVNRS
ncbi:hypothetical protein SMJ63A_150071 [Stenotrophomonas geniculata]